MFESYRRYLSCAFCDNTDLTKEHIFGKALARAFPSDHNWQVNEPRIHEKQNNPTHKGSSPILSIAPRLLCNNCNTNIFSRDMSQSLTGLKKCINDQPTLIEGQEFIAFRRYWERVALLIDVCTSNKDISSTEKATQEAPPSDMYRVSPPTISDQDRNSWLNGGASYVEIFIGRHTGVLGINPLVSIAPISDAKDPLNTIAKRIIVVIGHLAVFMFVSQKMIDEIVAIPDSFFRLSVDENRLKWRLPSETSYRDILSWPIMGSTPQNTYLVKLMENRSIRRRIERHSEKMRSFCIPKDILGHQ